MLNHFGSRATLRPALRDIRIKNNLILIFPFIAYNTRCVSEMGHVTKVTLIKLNIARSIQYIFYRRVARCYEVPTLCCVDLLYSISISMEMEYEVFGYTMHTYISYRFLQACIILHATSCGRPVLFDDSYSRVDSIIRDGSYHNKSRERDVSQMSIATIYVSRDNRYFQIGIFKLDIFSEFANMEIRILQEFKNFVN